MNSYMKVTNPPFPVIVMISLAFHIASAILEVKNISIEYTELKTPNLIIYVGYKSFKLIPPQVHGCFGTTVYNNGVNIITSCSCNA